MEEKYFMWFDSGRPNGPYYGPHGWGHQQEIGQNLYHSLSDLLKGQYLSDSLKKRLNGAKLGTKIRVGYLHSNGDLYLICISRDQANELDKISKLHDEMCFHDKEERRKSSECDQIFLDNFKIEIY